MELITPDIGLLFWMLFSFSIVLIILRKFAWKPILKALQDREESIETAQQKRSYLSRIKYTNLLSTYGQPLTYLSLATKLE